MKKIPVLLVFGGCVIQHDDNGRVTVPTPTPAPTKIATNAPNAYPKCPCPTAEPIPLKCWQGGITLVCAKPKPTPTASREPTPTPTAAPITVNAPSEALTCEKILVTIDGLSKTDDVVIWADKKYHIGRMFFNETNGQKYLGVKLNTDGKRVLDFRVNDEWKLSHSVNVKASIENCNLK